MVAILHSKFHKKQFTTFRGGVLIRHTRRTFRLPRIMDEVNIIKKFPSYRTKVLYHSRLSQLIVPPLFLPQTNSTRANPILNLWTQLTPYMVCSNEESVADIISVNTCHWSFIIFHWSSSPAKCYRAECGDVGFGFVLFNDTWSWSGHSVSCMTMHTFLNLQITRSDIKPHIKWDISLVTAYDHFNLPLGFVCVGMCGLTHSFYHPRGLVVM